MFHKTVNRSRVRLVKASGYVDLSTACVRANQTGYFALQQRVAPESFDGKDTNIEPSKCFFGGRRVDLALAAQRAEDYATRSAKSPNMESDSGNGANPDGNPEGK